MQRPNVLSDIALDLYLVRALAPFYQKYIVRAETDIQSLVNEWGRGFIAELDYREEAKNTVQFNKAMQARNLNAVMAPVVVPEYSSERILVTEWVDGTRIDRSEDRSDIPRLCSVALNAYLVMLLELKSLVCRNSACGCGCSPCDCVLTLLFKYSIVIHIRAICCAPRMESCVFWILA